MSKTTTLEQHLAKRYGELGVPTRNEFEKNSKAFAIGELIKEARKQANMTQTELAEKAGTKKTTDDVGNWFQRQAEKIDKKTDADKDNDGH